MVAEDAGCVSMIQGPRGEPGVNGIDGHHGQPGLPGRQVCLIKPFTV